MSNSFDSFLTNIGDVTVEQVSKEDTPEGVQSDDKPTDSKDMMNDRQIRNDDCSQESVSDASENERKRKVAPMRTDEIEEIRTEGSADDMDLDETIDSHIGVRMESERQHIRSLPSDNEEEEEEDEDDIGIDSVNILDTLPLEGAPIEGQEVSEADILGKMNEDDEDEEEKSRSGEEDSLDAGKRLSEHDDNGDPVKKKPKKEDGLDGPSEMESKTDKKLANMRRNIREVMDETQLDEATLAAQRQEMERLRRVQEQQRIIREVQRRQSNKGTSLLRSNQNDLDNSEVRLPNTVMLKVNSGSATGGQASVGQQAGVAPRRPMAESSRWQRGGRSGAQTSISRVPARTGTPNVLQQRIRMMTPSVSISPVVPKKEPIEHLEYYTDSDLSEVDAEVEEAIIHEKQMQQARKLSGASKTGQKAAKGKDVVTISSSSESSDDDCIVLSDPSEVEETDNEEDPANSGMHTNDRYNIPDEHGRVLVNVGHPDDEPDVFLAPQVARIIKPHQIGGIRFLYDNIVESIERFKTSQGFGCILAHSMGLGKTLQVASFCDIFFRCTDAKTVLCIMPINTLQNWLAEFNMWLPYEDPNKPKVEEKTKVNEENTPNDMSYIQRPGAEHELAGQHQHPPGMIPDPNNPYAYHGYNHPSMAAHYGPPGAMYDPRYGPTYPGAPGYPIKTEPNCPPQQMGPGMNPYGLDSRGMPQYNPGYPPSMQHPGSMHHTPVIPGHPAGYPTMDPNMHPSMHNMNPHTASMYPGYGASPNMPYPNYGAQPRTDAPLDIKKMENNIPLDQKPDIHQMNMKADQAPTEAKKESDESKKEESEEKKDGEMVKTPFSVDAPTEMEIRPRHFNLHILNDSHKTMAARARVIREWQKVGGVLLIGYELYRQLSLKKPNKTKRKRGQPFKDPSLDVEEEDKNKPLLDEMHTALVNPGPDLVICDEGHRIKNSHASISLALKQMRTKRRIVLTGYPLQNNLLEYWCMVDFVRPNYLGTKSEFCNMFERPIQNGQCIDSTPQDIRLMRYRAHVLHALLEGFVQRRSHSVLQISLPRKEEYILLVRMTPHQRKLYDTFMNQVVKTRAVPNPLKAFAVCCKIWNHPDVLYHFLKKRQANEEDDLDLEETMADKAANTPGAKRATKARQPKGEGKKPRKTNLKNKPAASVQPNALNVSNENLEGEAQKQQQSQSGYQNFNVPPPSLQGPPVANNSGFQHPNQQNSYQQQPQQQQEQQQQHPQQPQHQPQQQQQHAGYQNYPGTQGTEYNDFYANQNQQQSQQKYPSSGNQNFAPYSQNSNYPGANQVQQQPQQQQQQQSQQQQQQQQQYSGQQQSYNIPTNDTATGSQRFPGPSSANQPTSSNAPNFRADQSQATATSGVFPRPSYPYQQNYSQVPNQQTSGYHSQNQTSNQMGISEYNSYQQTNRNQSYNTMGQQMSSGNMNYQNSSEQNHTQNVTNTQPTGYIGNQQSCSTTPTANTSGYNQSQQMTPNPAMPNPSAPNQAMPNSAASNQAIASSAVPNQAMPNSIHQGNPGTQTNQNMPPMQTQPHTYPGTQSGVSNPMTASQGMTYDSSQQQQGYQQSVQQNQMGAYSNMQSNQNYGQGSTPATSNQQNQLHAYSGDQRQQQQPQQQQLQQSQSIQQAQHHQQPQSHQQPQQQQQLQSSQPLQQSQHLQQPQSQQQQHGYNQQTSSYPSAAQQPQQISSGQMGYAANQQAATTSSTQGSYGYQQQNQQNQTNPHVASQATNYPQNSQIQRKNVPQSEQQQQQHSYPQADSQNSQNLGNNYPATSATPHGYSTNPQIPPTNQVTGNQQQVPAQGQDQYWQRNYQNPSDQYYNDTSMNQYQGNYQNNVAPTGNYQQNQQSQQSQYQNYSANTIPDTKPPQQMATAQQNLQNVSQPTASNGMQNQAMPPPNNTNSVIPYNNTPNPPQGINNTSTLNNQSVTEQPKEEFKDKDDAIDKDKILEKDKEKEDKSDEEIIPKDEAEKDKFTAAMMNMKDDPGIPYDWAVELMKGYMPGLIDASAKMTLFFCILDQAILLGDRVLAFSQSLFTLNLIEDFLARNDFKYEDGKTESWAKNVNYYRLDGSTSALEREKLINEFNVNPKVHLFLVSTRAGSLGINLVGANRAIVFDASWNPCHDTQAVCRVYRYGQRKNCYVYRLVTDNCLERKIYDRQISKQGMADRVVDQCNPDAHLSLKEATTLSWDWEEDSQVQDFSDSKDKYTDEVMHIVLEKHSSLLTKQPFHHESLLVDRKDKKLSQAEKRLARRGYELEKMAANCSRPSYNYVPGNTAARVSVPSGSLQIRQIRGDGSGPASKPVASVRPMQQRGADGLNSRNPSGSRWIPAEVWQRQGMSAQEMTLPLDVVIPTNSPDKGSIVLKAGQRVMVLKSPKGIYMQLESGKIIAIRTALKINQQKKDEETPKKTVTPAPQRNAANKGEIGFPLRNNSAISIIPKSSTSNAQTPPNRSLVKTGANYRPFGEKEVAKRTKPVATATAKPYSTQNITNQVSLSRVNKQKDSSSDIGSMGENSNSSDGHKVRSEQRVEEVRIEDVVAETGSNSEYSPSSRPSNSDTDSNLQRPMSEHKTAPHYPIETSPVRPQGIRTPQDRESYLMDQKMNAPRKFDLHRTGQKEKTGSDEVLIDDPSQHQHSQQYPYPSPHQTTHQSPHQHPHQLSQQSPHHLSQQSPLQVSHQTPHHSPQQPVQQSPHHPPQHSPQQPSQPTPLQLPHQSPHQLSHTAHQPAHQTAHPTQHQSAQPPQHQSSHPLSHQSPRHTQHQPSHQPQLQPQQPHHAQQHQSQLHQPIPQHPQHPSRPQPRSAGQHGVPRVTSDVLVSSNKNLGSTSTSSLNLTSPPVPPSPAAPTPSRSKPTTPAEQQQPQQQLSIPRETTAIAEPTHPGGLPQGYPYAQYPRYYDYTDPRSRPLTDPYNSYYPSAPPPSSSLVRTAPEATPTPLTPSTVAHPKATHAAEESAKASHESASAPSYSRSSAAPPKSSSSNSNSSSHAAPEPLEPSKPAVEATPTTHASTATSAIGSTVPSAVREDPHGPTAFSHPSSVRSAYPGPYPPASYDPYSQHYPPAPASTAAYTAGAAPGYSAYGGPSYNADYARMYSAFHGPPPPPAADPYRSYAAPPGTHHPSNYYPPFSHPPPPPYPNYPFLPPYPNPNVPAEPQPPAQ